MPPLTFVVQSLVLIFKFQYNVSDINDIIHQLRQEVNYLKESHARENAHRDNTILQLQEKVDSLEQSPTLHTPESCGQAEPLRTLDLASQFPYLDLTTLVTKTGEQPVNLSGGFADIWSGKYGGDPVAIKVLRYSLTSLDSVIQRRIFREIKTWALLDHPNVLPLLGFSLDLGTFPALVSPWQPKGTASQYLQGKSTDIVFQIIIGATSGLEHLHLKGIRHGDFKGNNILVSANGDAVVCDFGLSKTAVHTFGMTTNTSVPGGNVRWMAPELVLEENAVITEESDVWSCGMTILELFSGHVPFHRSNEAHVISKMQLGELPVLPPNVEDLGGVANICKTCWARNPRDRPSVSQVHFGLRLQTKM